jgi:hypothetical protein
MCSTNKKVRFNHVYIYEHQLILGDSPAVSEGAPTCLDWECQHVSQMSLEGHERRKEDRVKGTQKIKKRAGGAAFSFC